MNEGKLENIFLVEEIYGQRTPFHDGEMISVLFERASCSATLRILLTEPDQGSSAYLFTLVFDGVEELVLTGFNHQNVIQQIVVYADGRNLKVD